MKTNIDCLYCIMKKADERFSASSNDQKQKLEFMKDVFALLGSVDYALPSPYISKKINDLIDLRFGKKDSYVEEKNKYNNLMLSFEGNLLEKINNSNDPLLTALKLSMVANFIDFGANNNISGNKLNELIDTAENQNVDKDEYNHFKSDLANAKNLTYLLDNSGEIVADKLLISTIKEKFNNLKITAIVRGEPVFNDVTLNDAKSVGLINICPVIANGTNVPGTFYDLVTNETKAALDTADLIISKGQGNFETISGSKRNIY